MAKKEVMSLPSDHALNKMMYFAQAAESRARLQILRKLADDLELLRKDEMRIRRSRKRTASVDQAVIAGQILGIKQAINAVVAAEKAGREDAKNN